MFSTIDDLCVEKMRGALRTAARGFVALATLSLMLASTAMAQGIAPAFDGKVTVIATPPYAAFEEIVTLSIGVENTGVSDLTGVAVTQEIPVNLTYLGDTVGGSFVDPVWTWTIGNLSAGASVTAEISVQVTTQGVMIPNMVNLSANETLSTPDDSTSTFLLNNPGDGYDVIDSLVFGGITTTPIDISASGTFIATGDDSVGVVNLSAMPFEFFGTDRGALLAATNGFLTTDLSDPGSDISPDCPIPATPSTPIGTNGARIYSLHDETIVAGAITHQFFNNSPVPHPTAGAMAAHVIQWTDIDHYPGGIAPITVDTLLFENGDILMQYDGTWPSIAAEPTVGVQSEAPVPALGTAWTCGGEQAIQSDLAVLFYRQTGLVDLGMEMTTPFPSIEPGDEVDFTITVTNHGPFEGTDIVVTDILPSGELTFLRSTCANAFYDGGTGIWTWTIDSLEVGESLTCTLTAIVEECAVIENTASVTVAEGDISNTNNTVSVVINEASDIIQDGSFETGGAWTGSALIDDGSSSNGYPNTGAQFVAFDSTSSIAQQVLIPVSHEATLSFNLLQATGGVLDLNGIASSVLNVRLDGHTVATITGLDPAYTSGYGEVVIDVTDHATGSPVTLEFDFSAFGVEEFYIDDVELAACAQVDMSLTKVGGAATAVPGDTFTYTITVTNDSPNPGTGRVIDNLDPQLINASWTCTVSVGSTCENESGTGSIDELVWLLGGGTAVFELTVTVDPSARGTISNSATVTVESGGRDPNEDDDDDTEETDLTPSSDISMQKNGPGVPVDSGSTFLYTLLVDNAGPSTASNVLVTDVLPLEVTFVSAETNIGVVNESGGVVTANIASLEPSVQAVIQITVLVDPGFVGTISNTASVEGQEDDPNDTDDEDTDETTIEDGDITVGPLFVNFGVFDVCAGAAAPSTITITNDGNVDLFITSVSLDDPANAFSIVSDTGQAVLGVGESRLVNVTYDSTSPETSLADLVIVSDDLDESEVRVSLVGTGSVDPVVGPQDLSTWSYFAAGAVSGAFGPDFPGDEGDVIGLTVGDDDGDSSGSDLLIDISDNEGMSYLAFYSVPGLIPFSDECVFKVDYSVTGDPVSWETGPQVRFRWFYGNAGELGGGKVVADSTVAAPGPDGRRYSMVFDQLPVEDFDELLPVGGDNVPSGEIPANSITLVWETLDLSDETGGGSIELDSVVISRFDRDVMLAAGTLERAVSDFSDSAQFDEAPEYNLILEEGISVATSAATAEITATFPNTFNTAGYRPFGGEVPIAYGGAGMVPFTPSMNAGRFYRTEYSFSAFPNTDPQPLPHLVFSVATHNDALSQQYTAESHITTDMPILIPVPQPVSLNGINPAPTTLTHSSYLHLPEGLVLGSSQSVGSRIGASLLMVDTNDVTGGTVTLTDMAVFSYSESLLP